MPRDSFSNNTFLKIKKLCSYLSLLSKEEISSAMDYKEIMNSIRNHLSSGHYPESEYRDEAFEEQYFRLGESIDTLYAREGRMFRHWMEFLLFFGIIKNSESKRKKVIDTIVLQTILLSNDDVLLDMFRNIMLNININNNDFISNLQGITIFNEADYKPVYSILRYCKEIRRPATFFEISVFLGRIDEMQKGDDILIRALAVGKELPSNQEEQIKMFFGNMGWKKDNTLFQYAASQQPYFKFRTFFIYLQLFGFINIDEQNFLITNTDYANELLSSEVPMELLDLEKLLARIDDDSTDVNELANMVLYKRTKAITEAIQSDSLLLEKFNKRNIRNPIIKNGKRKRNRIIAELAKIKANYKDEVTGKTTFMGQNGNYYVEAHHIIEFSTEQGPDITDNLICLGPDSHSRIHHGSTAVVDDLYRTLQNNGVLNLDRYKRICTVYRCLTKRHVSILYNKKLISSYDKEELYGLIDRFGVDQDFINSLSIPAD
jgi:hypothetical protein